MWFINYVIKDEIFFLFLFLMVFTKWNELTKRFGHVIFSHLIYIFWDTGYSLINNFFCAWQPKQIAQSNHLVASVPITIIPRNLDIKKWRKKTLLKNFQSRKFLAAKIINHVIDHAKSEKRKILRATFSGGGRAASRILGKFRLFRFCWM